MIESIREMARVDPRGGRLTTGIESRVQTTRACTHAKSIGNELLASGAKNRPHS